MAKTNYQFEKRQRDLAKKRKQEEKQKQKLASKTSADGSGPDVAANPAETTSPEEGNKDIAPADSETPPEA
jgi:hypothetical protein